VYVQLLSVSRRCNLCMCSCSVFGDGVICVCAAAQCLVMVRFAYVQLLNLKQSHNVSIKQTLMSCPYVMWVHEDDQC